MDESYRREQLTLPVGLDRATREPLPLADALADPSRVLLPDELSEAERRAVVRRRWELGGWVNVYYGTEGLVDLSRAVAELESGSDLGRELLAGTERAMAADRDSGPQASR